MAIRVGHFRWWQCLIVGLLIGVALWQVRGAVEASREQTFAVGLSIRRFIALASTKTDTPVLFDVRVHPAVEGKNRVTGEGVNNGVTQRFEFLAAAPFVMPTPRGGAAGSATPAKSYPSVLEYLDETKPSFAYRYMWWEEPRWQTALWFGTPVAVIGVLLPMSLALLRRLGVLPPLPVKEKPLPPPASEPAKIAPEIDHAGDARQLQAATDALEHRLSTATPEDSQVAAKVATTTKVMPAHVFAAGPADAPLPTVEKEQTSFDGGVYYPVHRPKRDE